jgi:hypothetical protein
MDESSIRDAIMAEITAKIAAAKAAEDHRNRLLNRNRLYVLAFMWTASLAVPILALRVLHIPVLAFFAGSVGYTGAAMFTAWSWFRDY